jgi:hypothetical protein
MPRWKRRFCNNTRPRCKRPPFWRICCIKIVAGFGDFKEQPDAATTRGGVVNDQLFGVYAALRLSLGFGDFKEQVVRLAGRLQNASRRRVGLDSHSSSAGAIQRRVLRRSPRCPWRVIHRPAQSARSHQLRSCRCTPDRRAGTLTGARILCDQSKISLAAPI